MAKETFYFSHDYNPTSDLKIQAMIASYGAVGYGLYWRIVETLHESESHQLPTKRYVITSIAAQMKSTSDFVLQFINDCVNEFELFKQENDMIFCDRVNRNIEKRNNIKEARKAAGSKGGVANAKQMLANAKQKVAKERKGKEIKGKENKEEDSNNSFEHFWQLYDKKVDRAKCELAWSKLNESQVLKIFLAVPLYVMKTPDAQYRKNPLTWLNGKCWLDEMPTPSHSIPPSKYVPTEKDRD